MPEDRIVKMPEAERITGLSKAEIERRIARQNITGVREFPDKRILGPRAIGFLYSELTEWARSRPVVIVGAKNRLPIKPKSNDESDNRPT